MKRVAVLMLLLALPATMWAHHSLGDIDLSSVVSVKGTVKKFIWANPHIWVIVDAPDAQGNMTEWSIEGPPILYMVRGGIRKSDINAGDQIEISFNPRRNNPHHGAVKRLTMPASGKTFGQGDGPFGLASPSG